MLIALLHGAETVFFLKIVMVVAIVFPFALVLIFVLFVRWAEAKMRSREELEKFLQENVEAK